MQMKKFALRKMDIIVINLLLQKSLSFSRSALWSSSSGETNPQYLDVVLVPEKDALDVNLSVFALIATETCL